MNAKAYITLVGVLLLVLLIGLAVLFQKRQETASQNAEKNESELALSGVGGGGAVSNIDSEIINSDGQVTAEQDTVQQQQQAEPMAPQSQAPKMSIDSKKDYSAVITTTEGAITIQFTAKETPITVNNFIALTKKGFYNGTIFHRVIDGFMIQGGDPRGDGTGGPGYKFADEAFTGEYSRGTVAMANSGPNTNGSQFFIMHKDNPLPPNYVIFGNVTEGLDVVDTIATAEVRQSMSGESSQPVAPVKITSIKVIEE